MNGEPLPLGNCCAPAQPKLKPFSLNKTPLLLWAYIKTPGRAFSVLIISSREGLLLPSQRVWGNFKMIICFVFPAFLWLVCHTLSMMVNNW